MLNLSDSTDYTGIGSEYIKFHLKINRIKLERSFLESPEKCSACMYRFSRETRVRNCARVFCVHIMSPNEILQYFSKILYILKLTSSLIQRWTIAFIICVLIWCVNSLISWIDTPSPGITNVFQFILPLIILAVVCGIFAETNAEGSVI